MLSDDLNTNLIAAIKEKLPSGTNAANALMNTLDIGREAVYRRLRGEVPFTFSEAVLIGREMNISLDSLSGNGNMGFSIVDVHFTRNQKDLSAYRMMLESQIAAYSKFGDDPSAQLHLACNVLPLAISLNNDHLSKFILFKWLYQRGALSTGSLLADFQISEDLIDLHRQYIKAVRNISHGSCLLDHMIFEYLASDLRYFFNIGLINVPELEVLKEDIATLIDELETVAERGLFPSSGKEALLHVSSVNFDGTYGCICGQNMAMALIKICGVNLVTSSDMKLVHQMKVWVESLRKFSTLISKSGEMQRITFFNKQRAIISEL